MSNESVLVRIFVREIGTRKLGDEVEVRHLRHKDGHLLRTIASFEEGSTGAGQSEFLFALDDTEKTILKIRKDDVIERVYS